MIFNLKKRIIFSFICILLVVSFASFVGYSGLFIDIFFDHNPRTSFEQEFSPIAKQHTQIKNEIFNQVKEKSQKIDWAFIPTIEAQNKKLKFGHVILVNNHISYRSSSLDTLPEDWYTLYQINEYDPTFDKDRPYLFDIMNNSTIYTQQDKIELISFNIFTPTEIPYFKYFALYNLMIIFLILGITTLTVYKIFKHIQNLVTQLSTMTEQITNGDIESEMSLDNENEFSRLAEHIDLLRQHLLASHKEKVEMEAERERMFSNITHDIKTPITSIKGYSQVLSSDYIEDSKTCE